jgi:hypothetical protein
MLLRATFGDALLRSHRELLGQLRSLRAASCIDSAPADLSACLERVRASLEEHFRFEEDNGYLASVLQRRPYLETTVRRLADEHVEILRALDLLREQARQAEAVTCQMRDVIAQWLRRVRRHEQREDALVEDAFAVDLNADE